MKKFLIIILLILLLVGCKDKPINISYIEADVESVNVDLVNISELEDSNYYSLEVSNNSSRKIKYIELAVGFEPTDSGKEVDLKNDAVFNAVCEEPFDIEVGESVYFRVHIPRNLIVEGVVDYNDIDVSVTGYFDDIVIENRFGFMGGIEHFSND